MSVAVKITVLCNVTYSVTDGYQRFEETYYLHLQGRITRQWLSPIY